MLSNLLWILIYFSRCKCNIPLAIPSIILYFVFNSIDLLVCKYESKDPPDMNSVITLNGSNVIPINNTTFSVFYLCFQKKFRIEKE